MRDSNTRILESSPNPQKKRPFSVSAGKGRFIRVKMQVFNYLYPKSVAVPSRSGRQQQQQQGVKYRSIFRWMGKLIPKNNK